MNIRLMSACSLAAALSVSALTPLSAAVIDATPVSQVAPAYSRDLRAACVEGKVLVSFTITAKGDVVDPVIVSSSDRHLSAAALQAVLKWKFAPAMKDGVAVKVKAIQSVAFVIPEIHSDRTAHLMVANSRVVTPSSEPTSVD